MRCPWVVPEGAFSGTTVCATMTVDEPKGFRMSGQDFDTNIEDNRQALRAYAKGDPEPVLALWSAV